MLQQNYAITHGSKGMHAYFIKQGVINGNIGCDFVF